MINEKALYVWCRPDGCPVCGSREIARVIRKASSGDFDYVKRKRKDLELVYYADPHKLKMTPSWKCCWCEQDFFSKKKYPTLEDENYYMCISMSSGPIGKPACIRVVMDTSKEDVKVFDNEGICIDEELTFEVKELLSYSALINLFSLKVYQHQWAFDTPTYWITILWKGQTRSFYIQPDNLWRYPYVDSLVKLLLSKKSS